MKKMISLFTSLMVLVFFLSSQEIIQNPEKPLSSNAGRILEVEEMFRITDETGEFFFKWPSQLKIADDGCIFLADESQFLKFTSDGKFIRNIYKKGQGPGEIQSPFFSYHLQDENIFIYDPTNTKIIFMDQDGELIEEFRLTERYFQFIGLQGENFILTKYVWPDIEVQTGKVIEIPAKILFVSKKGDIINECMGIPMKRFLHQNLAVPVPQSAYIISGDGKVCFISDEEEYKVSVVDLEKLEFIRKFKRDYPRVKRPKSKTPSRSSMKAPEKKYENDIVWLYNFKGNLWIETSTGDDKKGTLYDVFNRAGQYIDSFWLSTNGPLIATHEDYLFVREQDEEGSLSIVKYRVLQ